MATGGGEGVETQEQMKFLQAHGCDEAQGYYFSRPLVAEHFARLLKSGTVPSILKGGMATSPWLIATKKHSSPNKQEWDMPRSLMVNNPQVCGVVEGESHEQVPRVSVRTPQQNASPYRFMPRS